MTPLVLHEYAKSGSDLFSKEWAWVRIDELAQTCSGTTPSRGTAGYFGGDIPWIKTGELRDNTINEAEEYVTEKALAETSLKLLPRGTLLIAMYGQGQTRGRTGVLSCEATINQACFAILPNAKFDSLFLQLWFRLSYERLRKQTENRGGNQPNLNGDVLRQELVPLPDITEQRQIAGRLREQLAEVGQARTAARAQLAAAQVLPAAFLRDAFDDEKALQWPRYSIQQLRAENVLIEHQDGNHGELHPRATDFVHSGVKFVTAKHFRADGTVAISSAPHISRQQANELRIGFAEPGDVLLAHNATVGPVAITPMDCEPFIVGTSVTIFRAARDRMLPQFLFLCLKADAFQCQLVDAMKQTTRNQVPITRQRQLLLPLPSPSEQQCVVDRIFGCLPDCATARAALETRLATIESLPAALLSQAFKEGGR